MATTAETLKNFIDGESVAGGGESEPILNPATGEEIARAPISSAEEVDRAVRAARRAFEGWSNTTPAQRAQALLAIAHFWMQAKLGDNTPLPYTVVLLALLATRWRAWQRGERSTAGEVPERPGAASRAGRVAPAALPARPMPPSGTGSLR